MLGIITIAAAILGAVLSLTLIRPPGSPVPLPPPPNNLMPIFMMVTTAASFANTIMASYLLVIYITLYRKIKSEFTMGLIVVMFVLLLYAITANPFVHVLFGFQEIGLGPFVVIPNVFTTIALIVLLYLSLE